MKKLHLFVFLLFLIPLTTLAQERTKIYLDRSERGTIDNKLKISYLRKPVFRHDNAILTCDSAVFYEDKNVFEAYNNVHINQADTLNIYSDRLNYNGNTKMAHLTSNVRMVDQESVLTTNVLDYNLGTRIGTYVSGGKIVNKDVTLTSKNGYYFANTRDAFFRYNVVVVTPQTTIKSDTLRYNTLTNWTYFYGPTNIKGKEDNLYTENGAYNTKTEYAYFGKKNLYTSGSKTLKGDSLYYDGVAGYGKAVRNIVFRDTTDKTSMYGQLGYYYKADQRTVVTKNAYVGLGTNDSLLVNGTKQPDSLWLGADTLETRIVLEKSLKLLPLPIISKDNEVDSEDAAERGASVRASNAAAEELQKDPKAAAKKKTSAGPPVIKATDSLNQDSLKKNVLNKDSLNSDSLKKEVVVKVPALVKKDSLSADTLKKLVQAEVGIKGDSLQKKVTAKKPVKAKDSAFVKTTAKKTAKLKDTVINTADTVKARVIKAYHNVKVFKSNLQARADSLFYTSADSTLRWYKNPILWAEGSQQTGDTIYLQLRNKQINSVQVIQNSFTANVYKDSTRFNQIKGKLMTGFFTEGKLNRLYVDGNAESVYFTKTDAGDYKEMNRTISSRIKIIFKNDEISEIVPIKDVEGTTTPIKAVTEEVLLTGFIWKPELRPRSKADVTNPKSPAKPKAKVVAKTVTKAGGTPPVKKPVAKPTVLPTLKKK
ncbi:lipopolysaccharide export system protein LptA [Pedobacter sp. CAN_A7]|uniref:OstA-like protein n=1 Tax=Pedobacter sp. CAN_A7 TaxID=2787722 RepID=UPI0018C90B1D